MFWHIVYLLQQYQVGEVMAQEFIKTIEPMVEEVNSLLRKASEIKTIINQYCAINGEPPIYTDVEFTAVGNSTSILPDQFFGKGLSTAVKEYLKGKGRAATAQEIYDVLKKGGFEFPESWKEKEQLKNLAISLSKNRYDFVLVPGLEGNAYGLWEFYPEKKRMKEKKKNINETNEEKTEESQENVENKS